MVSNKLLISLFLMCTTIPMLFAQQSVVNGTIVDNFGDPLIGVTIAVKGTTTGTYSDLDGNFSIEVPENATLVMSYIGFVTQEVKVTNTRQHLNVVLLDDTQTLDEVVVVGYGTLQKKQVTSSISSISADKPPTGVGGATIATALQGKVSGLVIAGTDSPNAENTLQLRGPASINSSQNPLVVIDGTPGGDLRSLVQEDILSIDVLKDASAGAIYGTRAAAGVILVTTKSGQVDDGKVKMTYSGEVAFKQSFGKPNLMSADEYRYHEIGPDYRESIDWWDEALADKPTSQKHTVSLQTGTKNASLYALFMYENNRGIVKFEDRTDYAGRINAKFKLLEGWLEISTHTDYRQAFRNKNTVSMEATFRNNPTRSPYDSESESGYNVWRGETNERNTIADAALRTDEVLDKWFRPDVSLKVNVLSVPGLSVQQTVAYEVYQSEGHAFHSKYHLDEVNSGRIGTAKLSYKKTESLNTEGYATYIKSIGDHYINAVAGYSFFEYNGESFDMTNRNYTDDLVKFWNIGKGTGVLGAKEGAEMNSKKEISERLMAYFGRVNYSYKDKYMITATIRREGSSKFAKK
ncbi:MAG: SusC/RagA family TonB-linked outer membrane protein [Tannerellaceae bacterium]|nr:SusC/RagA family TonB-linked outer membrane protein [Tannerellaceae bacterium]